MANQIRFLSAIDVIAVHELALLESDSKPSDLVREGALESSVSHVKALAWYGNATLAQLAVDLLMGIALAHAWVDGNKRTSMRAMHLFLELNEVHVESDRLMRFARAFVGVVAMLPEQRDAGKRELEQLVQGWIDASAELEGKNSGNGST